MTLNLIKDGAMVPGSASLLQAKFDKTTAFDFHLFTDEANDSLTVDCDIKICTEASTDSLCQKRQLEI
ncbi:Oidioi.mRNA.OKI2018_I69.chr2.g5063.t1.cds [Oikopleura dioica]|uniref:Oidioi.mRNA.OKI2018_I69.chr2.g5063.t1.cds n=1 Tax=Oikopleura dioica TaxID=34765 RepID=A0ABN7T5X8_OIKDI|nr:Oidioi.mRNA.OKI2018_I69.chr2.g5063.t1.cds [Oikopleura dioica]